MNEIIINGWIARDKDNKLYLFSGSPYKTIDVWIGTVITELDENSFKNIKYSDKSSTKVELKININLPSTGEQK